MENIKKGKIDIDRYRVKANEKVWTGDLCKTVECCTGTRRSRANALRIIVNTIHSCL